MAVVGGDTSRAEQLIVSVAVTGEVTRGAALSRSGARPGDRLVVTGALGAAAGGLKLLQAPAHDVAQAVTTDWGRSLVDAHLRPVARVGEGQTLAHSKATAMMDVSDGLAKDLGRLCAASGVAAAVSLADVPVALSLKELADVLPDIDPLTLALEGGEDYELLATLPPDAVSSAASGLAERFGTQLTDIGEVRQGRVLIVVRPDGTARILEPRGRDPFGDSPRPPGADHRRIRFGRRGRYPGRPQDVRGAGCMGYERHHLDHRAEHQGGDRCLGCAGRGGRRADSSGGHRPWSGCGQDRDALYGRDRRGGGGCDRRRRSAERRSRSGLRVEARGRVAS